MGVRGKDEEKLLDGALGEHEVGGERIASVGEPCEGFVDGELEDDSGDAEEDRFVGVTDKRDVSAGEGVARNWKHRGENCLEGC